MIVFAIAPVVNPNGLKLRISVVGIPESTPVPDAAGQLTRWSSRRPAVIPS